MKTLGRRLQNLERARRARQERTEVTYWIHYEGDTEATGPDGERRPIAELPPGARRIVIEYVKDWRGV